MLAAPTHPLPPHPQTLPTRPYLDHHLTPLITQAFTDIATIKPENPTEYMGVWLLKQGELINETTTTTTSDTTSGNNETKQSSEKIKNKAVKKPEFDKDTRAYLDKVIVGNVMRGVMQILRLRPKSPVQFLATFLISIAAADPTLPNAVLKQKNEADSTEEETATAREDEMELDENGMEVEEPVQQLGN